MRVIFCHVIATTKAQLLDFKLGQKLFQFQRNKIFKKFQAKFQESLNMISEWIQRFLIIFLHIMTRLYL